MIKLTLVANSAADLRAQLEGILGSTPLEAIHANGYPLHNFHSGDVVNTGSATTSEKGAEVLPTPAKRTKKADMVTKAPEPETKVDSDNTGYEEETPEEENAPVVGDDGTEINIDTLRDAAINGPGKGKREELKKIFESFGVLRITELETKDYKSFLAKVNALA